MRTFLALFAFGFFFACAAEAAEEIKHTKEPLAKVSERIENRDAVLVDVRTEEEWREGHIQGARWIPLRELKRGVDESPELLEELLARLPNPKAKKTLYLHCKVGARALAATRILRKLGYDARAIEPGFEALVEQGFAKAAEDDLEPAPKDEKDIQLQSTETP